MDPRMPSADQNTGTLPVAGADTVRVSTEGSESRPRPDWLPEARAAIGVPGRYLAYEEDGRRVVVPLSRDATRIGRSLAADIRFDDATVSRRHALLAVDGDAIRVFDDRSLNGITVNGQRVGSCTLVDGDEIGIGRHRLYFFDTATAATAAAAAADAPAALAD